MKIRYIMLAALAALIISTASAQKMLEFRTARFTTGDNPEYCSPTFDDSSWRTLGLIQQWGVQNIPPRTGFGWYRIHFRLTPEMCEKMPEAKYMLLDIGKVDDAEETYLNGHLIGGIGSIPDFGKPYISELNTPRRYLLSMPVKALNPEGDNVLAIRVYNGTADGGKYDTPVRISFPNEIDGARFTFYESTTPQKRNLTVEISQTLGTESRPIALEGNLRVDFRDLDSGKVLKSKQHKVTKLSTGQSENYIFEAPQGNVKAEVTLSDQKNKNSVSASYVFKYILTPKAPESPRFNTTALYGVRPDSPIHFRFGVSGNKPLTFTAEGLPDGVKLNPSNGVLSGSVDTAGDYTFTVTSTNDKGSASQKFTLRVGDVIALTPPMGWSSWNCWGLSVNQDKVLASAQALIDKGLADYGYSYINIDDGWEAPERADDGKIIVNEKFPSMKAIGDWLHGEGLKFGIYSSPGDLTCGCFLGSLDHEKQDAESYNEWGVDYLKYDWCGYSTKHLEERDNGTLASFIRPFMLMGEHLRKLPRDIFYSLCSYGMANVPKWGYVVDANSWRTTGDITDTWDSMRGIGFDQQKDYFPYSGPGHWNDPDMLVVGKLGWGPQLHDSRLTPDEQYTHISLWALLAANMLIGCPIDQLDDFTIGLLCNNEVNAVNQDTLGQQARPVIVDGDIQIWARPLADGSQAVGIFNLGSEDATVDFSSYLPKLGLTNTAQIRDLWRQTNLHDLKWNIYTHGVRLLKITPNK